jgi:hypothetical protein
MRLSSKRAKSALLWVARAACPPVFAPRVVIRTSRERHSALAVCILLVVAGFGTSGCGYTVGNAFQGNVRSVYVPIANSDDFRRGYEFQLTEAVLNQIKERTPFRIAQNDSADTKLTMKIRSIRKTVLGTTVNNDPRELQVQFAVDVIWEDLRTGRVLAQRQVSLEPEISHLFATANMAPEVGQSLTTATHTGLKNLAQQIVDLMEAPW